ncbi:probable cytochrome P450 6a13 [Wyeomyia smithii]|uniref:probable cytochrome P450 6a13 n=1 Tax=Wyeomyia smithii TaxID=174621 RepID=UPI002467AF62|nr:probable cytochrome P450 6a13 [Wyeomyia smithii]XP_055530782.1 probable cytochrome P450 6a13 [Wyeomyia smithii]
MIILASLLIGLLYTNPAAFFLIIAVGYLLWQWLRYNFKFWQRENVPGPKPSLLFGNLGASLAMKKHIAEMAEEWYKEFPNEPFVGYYKVFKPAVFLRDPELIKAVLVKDHTCFSANDFTFNEKHNPLMRDNPFLIDGERWKKARQVLTPLYTGSKMKQLFHALDQGCSQFVEYIGRRLGEDLEAKSISAVYTTQNVVGCAFSLDAECFENPNNEWRVMGKKIFQPTLFAGITMLVTIFVPFIAQYLPIRLIPKEVEDWFRRTISSILEERKKESVPREDQLQTLLNPKAQTNLSAEQIAGHALTFFTEGYETSSTGLSFALYHLANNPSVQEKLHQEISRVIAETGDQLSYDDMQSIEYLDWVLQETLRINPPAAVLQKRTTKQYLLKRKINGQDVGTLLTEGTPVTVPITAIHMDPKYHPEPELFRPERFSPAEKTDRTQLVYFPFGEGPRMCLGMRFAQTQIKIALIRLVQSYRIRLSPNHKPFHIDRRAFLVQARDGLLLNFEKR